MLLIYQHVIDLETFTQAKARGDHKNQVIQSFSPSHPQQQQQGSWFGNLMVEGPSETRFVRKFNIPVRATKLAGRNGKVPGK